MKHEHTRKRTVAKAVSWESISNAICLGLAYLMFGNFGGCLIFTGICFILKLGLFYYHDELWDNIPFGKCEAIKFKNPKSHW